MPSQDVAEDTKKEAEEKPDFSGKRVLLAEDTVTNQMIANVILSEAGLSVDIANDGAEAVKMMEDAPAGYYDIILMDIQMPNMDGYEAAKKIRSMADKEKAETPIVAVTANAFEEDRKVALEAGMNAHLAKPYDIQSIMDTLSMFLK
jgi:CheY-like chemotaxis protein